MLSSFSEISNVCFLLSVVFPSLIAHSIMPWSKVIFIMLLQSPMNFLMSSSFLSSGSGFFDSGGHLVTTSRILSEEGQMMCDVDILNFND